MRTIDRASAFKRDYKREAKAGIGLRSDSDLKPVLLATDQPLDAKFRDHDHRQRLGGVIGNARQADLLLIYRVGCRDTLRLARFGSRWRAFRLTCR